MNQQLAQRVCKFCRFARWPIYYSNHGDWGPTWCTKNQDMQHHDCIRFEREPGSDDDVTGSAAVQPDKSLSDLPPYTNQ